jgi:two-component system, cell cycle sensor histidine kinase and response regulator CckA
MAAHSSFPFSGLSANPDEAVSAAWNAIPEPLLTFDANQTLVFLNDAARAFFAALDLSTEDAGFRRNLKIFEPDAQNEVPAAQFPSARALRGEVVKNGEYMLRNVHHGASSWVECSAQPVRDSAGAITGALMSCRDITQRKKREFQMKATDAFRDFMYRSNLAGIVHSSVDGRILDCNEALARMLRFSSLAELRSLRTPQLYWDPTDRDRVLDELTSHKELREAEICLRRNDNSRCWVLANARLIEPPPGEMGGSLLTTLIDITERKLWEETLRQSQDRFSAFMRYLPGVAFIKDLSGKYIFYNEASLAQFGKRSEDILGKTDEDIWPAENAARYRENDEKVIATGKPVEFLEPVVQEDGPHTWQIYKFPIMDGGEVAMVGGIGIDVSERRVLEDQLAQSRKMEALGRLAGGVAHDFNNLLTIISGYGQLALESLGNTPTQRMTVYLQEILNSARRASALTGQLLAFSRRQTVQPKVLDLGSLLHNMERLLQRMIGEHVDLSVRCGHGDCLIRADLHQMEQVLMNLVVNARDAMPLGGMLEIECKLLPEPVERPGREPLQVLLEVRDTGIGMDEAVKAQMFEPFFTSKDKGKGTGLGLSTVYGVISQAGGDIEVESEPGKGSQFKIYFPLAEGAPEDMPSPPSDAAPVGLETVLLVEDEPGVRALAETVLKKLGYKVLVADGGEAALSIWGEKHGSIDVLLTDVIMPQMSGGDLAHRLREMNPRLKILFMSGYTDDILASHGVLSGETQLIQKPFTAEALGRKLRSVLDA